MYRGTILAHLLTHLYKMFKTYRKSVLDIKHISSFSAYFVLKIIATINTEQVLFRMHAETCIGVWVKCSSLLSIFNQNWNMLAKFSRILQYWKFHLSNGYFGVTCRESDMIKLTETFSL